jgi:hypothetical protein
MAYGKWVTNTWLKSIWEKVDKFNVTVEIACSLLDPLVKEINGSCKQ